MAPNFTENALNKGLDSFEHWRTLVLESTDGNYSEHIKAYTTSIFKAKVAQALEPQKPIDNDSLIFLAAAGREMFNYQKENFLEEFKALTPEEQGHLVALYKGLLLTDLKQAKLAKLIPILEVIVNARIDTEHENKRDKS